VFINKAAICPIDSVSCFLETENALVILDTEILKKPLIMNKNVSRLAPDQNDRLKEIELTNGQTVVFSYDREDKLVGVEIRLARVDPEEEPQRITGPKEDPKTQDEVFKTASAPPPPPFSKSALIASVQKQEKALAKEEPNPHIKDCEESEKPTPPPPPPIKKEKEAELAPPSIKDPVEEAHTDKKEQLMERDCNKCSGQISQSAVFCRHCGVKQ